MISEPPTCLAVQKTCSRDLRGEVLSESSGIQKLRTPARNAARCPTCACSVVPRNRVNQRLVPIQQLVMSRVRRIAKLDVLAGGTLSANRLEINRRKDGVLGLDNPWGSFLEQRYRGLTAARAMKDVNI